MGRVPLIREVVHPKMPQMRAVFGGVGGRWFLSGAAAFLLQRWQMFLLSGSGIPHSVQKCMGVDRCSGGIWGGFFYVRE